MASPFIDEPSPSEPMIASENKGVERSCMLLPNAPDCRRESNEQDKVQAVLIDFRTDLLTDFNCMQCEDGCVKLEQIHPSSHGDTRNAQCNLPHSVRHQ
jgi:hypothetical protein